jgi:hypothetical protein
MKERGNSMPDDMRIPTRGADQINDDAVRTRSQVQQLGAPGQGIGPNPDLDEMLRAGATDVSGALQFDTLETLEGGEAYVVSRQLLLPVSDRRVDADSDLARLGFERREPSADEDIVWVYTHPGGTDAEARADLDQALTTLRGNEIPAAPTMVGALQMVLKSADGPAPTTVTVESFSEAGASLTSSPHAVVVAVIDTGIDEPLRTDGWLNEVRALHTNDSVDKLDVFPATGTPAEPILDYGAGHGTFVAGIIRQVDPQAQIVVYRALDTRGLASEEDVANAMTRAADNGAGVISLSLGMLALDDNHPCPHLQTAVQQIMSRTNPPAIVAAAGNNGDDKKVYPAALKGVVAVAALQGVDPDADPPPPTVGAEWSSFGPWVDCSVVGEGIVSTFVKGKEDQRFGTDSYPGGEMGDSWAVWSGTSFAAPQIAALIARTCRTDQLTPQQAVTALFPAAGRPADGYGKRILLLRGTPPSP